MYLVLNNRKFKIINENTKKAQQIIEAFNRSTLTRLNQCYNRYSKQKEYAFEYCLNCLRFACDDNFENYSGMYITGYNSCTFSCACTITIDNKNYLMYFTHCNDYIIPFEN